MNNKQYKKILLGFLGLILILSGIIFHYKNPSLHPQPQTNLNAPIEIPSDKIVNFNELKDTSKPAIVMYYVDWCTYCRRFMPVFGELSKKYWQKYNFAVVNCEYPENLKLVEKAHIIGFPTLKIVDKKYDFTMSVDLAATQDNKIFESELNQYIALRNRIKN